TRSKRDWSSDVCSSDLFRLSQEYCIILFYILCILNKFRPCIRCAFFICTVETRIPVAGVWICHPDGKQISSGFLLHPACQLLNKIGRASCREREWVCGW